jgi:hypothetical protein
MSKQWKIGTSTGNTTVTSERPLNGELLAVYVQYAVTPNAASDVTIQTVGDPVKTILTVTDSATNSWYYPRYVVHSEAAAALTGTAGGDRTKHPIDGNISFTVAQGDSDQETSVWVVLEC